mmetsp:Transcript_12140/g.21546  ORF Transcript_12140/g.21546 Transcript_12140/m.21546 type:complete len:93 (-) Transcript_12140:178-456(-)
MPRFRRDALTLEFTAPMSPFLYGGADAVRYFKSNLELSARRHLESRSVDFFELPDATHFNIGVDHAWEIASRLGKCQRGRRKKDAASRGPGR